MNLQNQNIIFFDGYCHLCNAFIDFLVKIDSIPKLFSKNEIYFASLQSETAKKLLSIEDIQKLDTVIFFRSGLIFTKSDAVIESLSDAFFLFSILKVFYILPQFFRNKIYDLVAKNRYHLFGKRETCRLPTRLERQKILD